MKRGKAHIIGVCGVAMGGVAVLLKEMGFDVSGSDAMFFPPISSQLQKCGIKTYQFSPENVRDSELVIVGNSVSRDNPEVLEAQRLGIRLYSYPEIVNEFFGKKDFFVITGTHGKTTTTSLIAYMLWRAGLEPSFLVGGVPLNFGVSARASGGDIFVIEGDEYGTSFFDKKPKFLHFKPKRAVIGPVEVDHVDMYESFEDYKNAFKKFANTVSELLSYFNSDTVREIVDIVKGTKKVSYHHVPPADFFPTKIDKIEFGYSFRINDLDLSFSLKLFGKHNIMNALSAFSLVGDIVKPEKFKEYLEDFRGVKRRLEVVFSSHDFCIIDDFAHHPTEIESGLRSLREFFDIIVVAFEPRSYTSRTKVHQEGFKRAFELADAVVIGRIFREEKIPPERRIDPNEIVLHLRSRGILSHYSENVSEILAEYVQDMRKRLKGDQKLAVVFMTSGDFYGEKDKFISKFRVNSSQGQFYL